MRLSTGSCVGVLAALALQIAIPSPRASSAPAASTAAAPYAAAAAATSAVAGTRAGAGDTVGPLQIASQGSFFAGGRYVDAPDGKIMADQIYVEFQIPSHRSHPYPIVMIHGGGQTGTNFESTPDGRPGWRDFFLSHGYAVYVVDQPEHGRSPYHPDINGTIMRRSSPPVVEQRLTAPERFNLWPQAHLHTQWPGEGRAGDPAFEQFFASQVEQIADVPKAEILNKSAGAALLDRIGPAIILTHSQSGPFGWQIGDARPDLVKGIVAVEPAGPPVNSIEMKGAPDYFKEGAVERPWGITSSQITYSPAVSDAAELQFTQQSAADGPGLVRCRLQTPPARQLSNLRNIPVLMISSQASYHVPYDHCTSQYLTQAGVKHTYIRLPDVGIFGNGHMMMLEKNNLIVAAVIQKWTDHIP